MKRKFVLVGVFGTVVLGLLAVWFYSGGDLNEYAGRLDEVRAEAKAEGLPLSLSEVEIRGELVQFLNAAPAIANAHEATERVGREYEAPEDEGIDALRASLEGFDAAIRSWAAAGGFKECKFERDWELGIDLRFPEFSQVKSGAKLLLADARLARLEDDLGRWENRVSEAQQLARHVASDPVVIAGLVRLAIDEMVLTEIADALRSDAVSGEIIEACKAALNEPYGIEDILYGLRFDSASIYAVLDQINAKSFWERVSDVSGNVSGFAYPVHLNADAANEAAWLELTMLVQIGLSESSGSWPELLETFSDFDTKHIDYDSLSHRVVQLFFVVPEKLVQNYCQAEALRRIVFVAAAAFDYHRTFRQFPADMPVLGEMGTDPFSGQPFVYSNLGLGFTVYSVGTDRADNGGPPEAGFDTESNDIGFRYEPSPAAGDNL